MAYWAQELWLGRVIGVKKGKKEDTVVFKTNKIFKKTWKVTKEDRD